MNDKAKIFGISALVIGFATFGVLSLGVVSAQNSDDGTSFIEKLANKLGLPTDEVSSAVESTRTEILEEREAERQATIEEAVQNGDLTERQSEILEALHQIKEDEMSERSELSDEEREAMRVERREEMKSFSELSEEEREAAREELRAEKQAELIAELEENGVSDVTSEELEELRETMEELGIHRPHHKGFRKGFKRGYVEGQKSVETDVQSS